MSTMNISLPEALKDQVDEQVAARGYGTNSAYVCDLIRRDVDRHHVRNLLLQGAASAPMAPVDKGYFADLRQRARRTNG